MTSATSIARPYAKAAFEYAKAEKALAAWQAFLHRAAIVLEQPEALYFLHDPRYNNEQKLKFLIDVIAPENQQQKNFMHLLSDYQRFDVLPEIAMQFHELVELDKKEVTVTITSAFALNQTERERLLQALKIRLQQAITPEFKIDPSLMGGCLIQAGDFVIDGSVRGKLQRMKESLTD